MATPNSASPHHGPPKKDSHISVYPPEAPQSFTPEQVKRFGILYLRAYCIDHFLDGYRVKGKVPGRKNKDAADRILGEWNTEYGPYKGLNTYEDLETLKSSTSKAKLKIREMMGLVTAPAKAPAMAPANRVAKGPAKGPANGPAKHAAKKTTVTAKKPFNASC